MGSRIAETGAVTTRSCSGSWLLQMASNRRPKAKAAGVYRGRPESIDGKKVHELRKDGMSPKAPARA